MITNYDPSEFNNAKSYTLLPLTCINCGCIFHKNKRYIVAAIRRNTKLSQQNAGKFCSNDCNNKFRTKQLVERNCSFCGEIVLKHEHELKQSSSKLYFCNRSCSCSYKNIHKKSGFRFSKIEKYIRNMIEIDFPNLNIIYNDRKTIKLELDILIPSIYLAFELNGITHYQPIFGEDKFSRIKENDYKKISLCCERGITLHQIDISHINHFNGKDGLNIYNFIKEKILASRRGIEPLLIE